MNEKNKKLEAAVNHLCDIGYNLEIAHNSAEEALPELDMPSLKLQRSEVEAIRSAIRKITNLLNTTIDDIGKELTRDE